jgi:L-Ala-D/L-Glu epimerase
MSSLEFELLTLEKRVPLKISRGTITHSEVMWLRWHEESCEGWGEAAPFSIGGYGETMAQILAALEAVRGWLGGASGWDREAIEQRLRREGRPSALIAGLNQALYDWLGKRLDRPVWRMLGAEPTGGPITSVTVGISDPTTAVARVRQWRAVADVRAFKIKLGSPAGIAADQAMFLAVQAETGPHVQLSVDANGGWSVADACLMAGWLSDRGLSYLEQPLARGQEKELPAVRAAGSLRVMVDESCFTAEDVDALADLVDGVNIKLMKCGGLDAACRLIAKARERGLRLLVGCYGHTSLGNTAAATLASLVDELDLDSHLNLQDDPFRGVTLADGRIVLPDAPGFGIVYAQLAS